MKKLKDLLNETINPQLGKVYSDPYAKSFVKENEDEESSEMTTEQKHAFLEAVKAYKSFGETVYRNEGLSEVYESIRGLVEAAGKNMVKETEGSFDGITVSRHVKRMNESFKIFEKTLREVATLQQRLESSYDEIGETLGKYYEINETDDSEIEEGNEFGAARAKAIANGDSEFEVDGKTYKVTNVDKEDKENAEKFASESLKEFNYPQSKMSNVFNLHFAQLTDKLPGMFYIVGRDVYHNDKKIVSLTGMDSVKSAVAKVKKKLGIKESMNEGASTEEKRIVMLAVRKIAKYRGVPIDQSVVDVIRAAEELEKDIKKGKVKESKESMKLTDMISVNEVTKYKVGQKTPVGKIVGTSVWGKGRKQEWFYDIQKPGYSPVQYSEKSLDKIMGESVNEAAGKEAMGIAAFTGTRGDAVQKFIDDNKLDARKLFNYVKGGKLKDRMDLVSAIAGKPNNPIQTKMIKMFGESVVNEGKDVGHYERVGNQTIVDSNFVNYSKGVLPNSELVHLGMGDFAIKSPKGMIKFQRSGKLDGIGQDFVGRPHRMTDDKNGKLVELFLKLMLKKEKAILSMSESVNEASEEFVVYVEKDNGRKKLLHTKQSQRAANMFLTKNADKILNQSGIRTIGSMSKFHWEKDEAQYAENIKKTDMKTVTKKEWDTKHKDYKGMIKGQPYMMYMDKKGTTVYGPVNIEESVNEASEEFVVYVEKDNGRAEKSRLKKEATFIPNSGTMSGGVLQLDNRKYQLKKDVKNVQIGNYTNIVLPKGTILYNIPGGLFADHKSLEQYETKNLRYFKKSTFRGIQIKQKTDVIKDIDKNSKVLESVNEGLSVTDERHFGKTGIIIMIDDNGKKVSAIFKNKKNADKYNRNKASDLKALLDLAKNTPYPKAIDESINEAKYDIGMARKGNGITVYNRAEEEKGDYKNIAHISDNGTVKYYDKKLPNDVKKKIEAEAKKMMEITNEGNSMIKLKDLMNESFGFGELPSSKLMKMKVSAKEMLDSVGKAKVNESEEDESVTEARVSAKKLLQSVVDGQTDRVEGIKLSKEMAEAYLNWLRMSPFGKKYGKLPFNKLFTASFRWGLHRHADEKSKEYKDLKAKAKGLDKK